MLAQAQKWGWFPNSSADQDQGAIFVHHMFPASVPRLPKGKQRELRTRRGGWPAVAPREKPRTAEPLGYFIKTSVLKRNL